MGPGFDSQGCVTFFHKYCFPNLYLIHWANTWWSDSAKSPTSMSSLKVIQNPAFLDKNCWKSEEEKLQYLQLFQCNCWFLTMSNSEHNRVAHELKIRLEKKPLFQALSSAHKDECLYQEARRIVIAEVLFPHFWCEIFPPKSSWKCS